MICSLDLWKVKEPMTPLNKMSINLCKWKFTTVAHLCSQLVHWLKSAADCRRSESAVALNDTVTMQVMSVHRQPGTAVHVELADGGMLLPETCSSHLPDPSDLLNQHAPTLQLLYAERVYHRVQAGIPPWYVTSQLGQLSLASLWGH